MLPQFISIIVSSFHRLKKMVWIKKRSEQNEQDEQP